MLLMMRASGYLDRSEDASDLRVRRYVPTAKLLDLNRDRQRRVLEAVDILRGGSAYAPQICGESDPEPYRRFVVAMGRGFLSGFRPIQSAPILIRIADRDVGLPLMMSVFLTSPEYYELCPERLRNVSVAALARRASMYPACMPVVSLVHARSVLRAAESAGFVLRNEGTAQVRGLPPLVDALENFFANAFLFAESSAQIALTETA
jgi:hypothetical protein